MRASCNLDIVMEGMTTIHAGMWTNRQSFRKSQFKPNESCMRLNNIFWTTSATNASLWQKKSKLRVLVSLPGSKEDTDEALCTRTHIRQQRHKVKGVTDSCFSESQLMRHRNKSFQQGMPRPINERWANCYENSGKITTNSSFSLFLPTPSVC